MFFQWANQTYNAGLNYGNRNASTKYTAVDLGSGYIGACIASMGIAAVTRTMFAGQLKSFTGAKFLMLNGVLNYVAVGSAGFLNCSLMRLKETKEGIDVTNKANDIVYGKSKAAGKTAVLQTGLSRAILPILPILLPGVVVAAMMQMRLYPKNNVAQKVIELGLCTGALTVGLPMSIAVFKSQATLERSQIESEFQSIKRLPGDFEPYQNASVYKEKNLDNLLKMANELD